MFSNNLLMCFINNFSNNFGFSDNFSTYVSYVRTGEVLVWDTGREDDMLIASSGNGDDSHREAVSKLTWVVDPESHGQKFHVRSH